MKKLLFLFVAVLSVSLFTTSCKKDANLSEADELIQSIATAENSITVEPDELPTAVTTTVDERYFETYIFTASLAQGLGYEVELGNGENLYFRTNGEELRGRRGRRHGHGPCGGGPQMGTPVDIADLPTAITDYIANNYSNPEIKRAKTNDDGEYFVKIKTDDGRVVAKFDADGNFIEEVSCIHHGCGGITQIDIADLPTSITDYVTTNYPDATIQKAGQKTATGHYGVVLDNNGDRVILIFDGDGNFLFVRN